MKGKILCPTGCQNPISRITKAKENLKSSRSAGSWRPFKCIFGERKKGRAQRAESPAPFALCTEKPEQGQSEAHLEQVSTTVPKSAILRFCPSRETCWGVPSPNPACRPRGLHIIHFRASAKVHSFRRSSSPHATRFAGLARGPHERRQRKEVYRPCERNTTHPTAAAL